MPFIQTSLAQSESASSKATTLYVYRMLLFLVACLLNRWQKASSARCLENKARGLTTPRSSKPPFPDSADLIVAEIEVSQRCALRQHSCNPLCPGLSDLIKEKQALFILACFLGFTLWFLGPTKCILAFPVGYFGWKGLEGFAYAPFHTGGVNILSDVRYSCAGSVRLCMRH